MVKCSPTSTSSTILGSLLKRRSNTALPLVGISANWVKKQSWTKSQKSSSALPFPCSLTQSILSKLKSPIINTLPLPHAFLSSSCTPTSSSSNFNQYPVYSIHCSLCPLTQKLIFTNKTSSERVLSPQQHQPGWG